MPTVTNHAGIPHASEPIAIVSAACRLPGHVGSPHKLWELLQSGGTAVSINVPKSRFDIAGHFDGSGRPGTMKALSGMFIEDIDPARFDAPFFNLTQADAIAMDPQQRQLLEVVYECFENGGVPIERVSGEQIGCFVGSYTVDYHDIQNRSPGQRMSGMTVGIGRAIMSNRISHFYNLKGPSWTIDTACSGGLLGVDMACQYIRAGKMNGAIVAAANLWLSPEHTQELGTMRAAYSPTGRCHTFDAKADGYCRAEAVNAVYLKRLSDAIKDGDPIRAVIRGTANNSDGWTPGLNSPSSDAQAAVIRAAYADAGLDSSRCAETGFLECHGTGTPTGDPLEVNGAASVLAYMRSPSEPLMIGSIKGNIGHSEPAAGISGLIKAMMAVEHGWIPGNPNFVTPNPEIDFQGLRIHVAPSAVPWPKALHKYRRASVNSFGYGGSNVHVVLDNAQQFMQASEKSLMVSRPHASSYVKSNDILSQFSSRENRLPKSSAKRPQLLVFSANDQDSLKRQIEALSAHLLHPRVKIKLSDLSYTLSERRSRLFCRAFVLVHPTKNGHASSISVDLAKFAKTRPGATRVGFVFTGQGAQWSQMGAELVNMFPETTKKVLEGLDRVLQQLPAGLRPEWSLLRELTEPRSSEHLSKPEFSQPLVTAMQLIQLSVLDSWGVHAQVVVGHSSGEIAAACCAGLLSSKQAILVAYLRGLAAGKVVSAKPMGMLAVGLSKEAVQLYLDATGDEDVVIACHNSATSVTVSGPSALLAEREKAIKADGHFARVLQVDVGYHSHHMTQAARYYEDLLTQHAGLEKDNETSSSCGKEMISSVTEDLVTRRDVCEAAYWKANMVSPVRFHEACKKTISTKALAANFFIELGPSNSLKGPIEQIVKEIGLDDFTYTAASKRGPNSVHALFDAAGQAFLNNAGVSLPSVNTDESAKELSMPAIITDLPNYQWNHSTQYWHESLASKDWRFKKFPEHDLLGSKVLGTLWQNPSWTKTLRLSDVPWLRDHKIGFEILFPAAGYIAMAMEAVRQATFSTAMDQDLAHLKAKEYHYCLKDVQFSRGLVLEDDIDVNIMLLLYPLKYPGVTWWQYKIMSSMATAASSSTPSLGSWIENSSGLIRLEFDTDASLPQAPEGACTLPLAFPSPGKLWYKAMKDAGYSFGPDFQKQLAIECTEGKASSRALIILDPPRSKWEPQSAYPLHPAPLDSCIQSTLVSLHRGIRSGFDKMLLPSNIEELTISGLSWYSGEAISVTSSKGSLSNASVYEVSSEKPILNLRGISFATMEVRDSIYRSHTYAHLVWKPDIGLLDDDEQLQKALSSVGDDAQLRVQELLDLTAHKAPNLKVLEMNLCPNNTESLWLSANQASRSIRAASGEFHFVSNTANTVLAAQQMYAHVPGAQNTRFSVMDPSNEKFSLPPGVSGFDLVIVRRSQLSSKSELKTVAGNVCRLLVEGGLVIFYDPPLPDNLDLGERLRVESVVHELEGTGFVDIRKTACGSSIVAEVPFKRDVPIDAASVLDSKRDIFLLYFSSEESPVITQLVSKLRDNDWSLNDLYVDNEMGHGLEKLPRKSTVLVLDEISKPFLATATEEQWIALQSVIEKECDILWVAQGSQIKPTEPLGAVGQGVFRAVRAEIPTVRLVTLDIESATIASLNTNLAAIEIGLKKLKAAKADALSFDYELAERGGQMHISRIRPDESLNQFKSPDKPPNDALEQQANSLIHPDRSYIFVGGLKGICGSLSIHLALRGAKHIAIMSRSGFQDSVSQAVAHNIRALGCSLHLVQGDVTLMEDVRRCFKEVSPLIGGIIQGAAVYKDRTFESLSHAEYHAALACKVKGSSNLHFASLELEQPISFFTILSSISGVVGNKGQASYAGGNAFEDALAGYRRAMGLPAISIDLGPVDDIGVIQGNDALQTRFEADNWFKINEGLLRRIFDYSLLRQHPDRQRGFDPAGQAQMITGLAYPQPTDSELLRDVRFAGLGVSQGEKVLGTRGGAGQDKGLQALFLLAQSNEPDRSAFLTAAVTVVGRQLTKQLRLPEAADPARQLLQYGMDSLAAVELRNWVRATLGVELTTLDIVNAASLTELCGKIIGKMAISSKG